MKIKTIALLSAALLLSTPTFALDLSRCENLDPLDGGQTATQNVSFKSTGPVGYGTSGTVSKDQLGDVGCGPAGTCLPASLSSPVTNGAPFKVVTTVLVDNPDIPQFRDGEVNVKESLKASIKASIEAGYPVKVEVIDWNAAQAGSC